MSLFRRIALYLTPRTLRPVARAVEQMPFMARGILRSQAPRSFACAEGIAAREPGGQAGELARFFQDRSSGRGVHKWLHFLPIYERYLAKFRGGEINLLEIGVQSGGSLDMWRHYFGDKCRIFGVDIDQRCKSFEQRDVTIHIGDQADRRFWDSFRNTVPPIDVVVDDGGHAPRQQIASFEELFPHLRPGGVYLCEDVYGNPNAFATYVGGFSSAIHEYAEHRSSSVAGASHASKANPLQRFVAAVHSHPYIIAIEKNPVPVETFTALRKGSEWLE